MQKLKGEVRAQKLAPLLSAVKGVQGFAKRVAANQQKNSVGNKDLFGTTKSPDELLFGTKTKTAVKTKKKKLKKVYYEYK